MWRQPYRVNNVFSSIVVVSPEFERVSIGLNIIIPFPEVSTVLFHGSMVSLYLSIVLWCICWILIELYMILSEELLYLSRILSSLICSYRFYREWNLRDEFRKKCKCRSFIMVLKYTWVHTSTRIINSCKDNRTYSFAISLVSPRKWSIYLEFSSWNIFHIQSPLFSWSIISCEVPYPISLEYTVYSKDEKREILAMIQADIVLKDKQVYIELKDATKSDISELEWKKKKWKKLYTEDSSLLSLS